jgi:hypothetical protein
LVNYKKQKKILRRERIKLNQWLRLPHDQNIRGIIGEDPNPFFSHIGPMKGFNPLVMKA